MESAGFVRQLGRGAFGTVDLVEVATPSGGVACVVRKTLEEDAVLRKDCGGVAAARRSPFAPAVVGMTMGQEGHRIFTEFADGGSLLDVLKAVNVKGYAKLGEEGRMLPVCGTAVLIAPEQFGSGLCRANADCYSLGVTMAECAVWPADRVSLWEFTKGERPLPDCVPEDLWEFIGALTERDPARRPSPTEALQLPFLAGLRAEDCM
ncbi:hypothetical protein GPECTOR_7g1253 [Gonium pectorale]|uniref:Protein kinase domain-containing protein n=1 Tax=Gonium pectorale TaxID=33097 RepID=A0A150GU17_GONPE|nr:hypothetical protein GPECTOR_7g1253 [Gonium pectorale]|eukprot:KXZ53357.1 hypothetical protein GPECTOR_7g1253 [Gonium pectorale]